jgi:propionyl-CoA carboxylase alpha chain
VSFATVLVANRGEIARRVMRSARAMGTRCLAVYTAPDSGAPFVGEADQAIRLDSSYLDAGAVIAAAKTGGADAVHPGYGFLSENAAFARAVTDAGLAWVGPPPEAIERMGDKLAAKALARQAGVPTLPSTEDESGADKVGYPLLVKAAAGGGGKGMRIVSGPDDLAEALTSAKRESLAAFGDDRVFLERYVSRSHHIEIQILGDKHGNLVHLGERECSIQRRHQKIIEEAPSPRVDSALRQALGNSALGLARALGYHSAGTVEFLLDDETGEFFFLEVNTRLQVEHPVTEAITGIDLVREQLRVAAGEKLGLSQDDIAFNGHAVEARLYAEDPAHNFLPATGTLAAFEAAADPTLRWDSGVETGSVVGPEFDPMLAKVIAHAATRNEATGRLALGLERSHLAGLVTNRDFLVAVLRSAEFRAGDTTTDFIERVGPARRRIPDPQEQRFGARAAALWIQAANREQAPVLASTPSGWTNSRLPDQRQVFVHGDDKIEVNYRRLRDGTFRIDGQDTAQVHECTPAGIEVEIGGQRAAVRMTRSGDRLFAHGPHGDIEFQVMPRFELPGLEETAGGLTAPMPGKVIDLRIKAGDTVSAGQTLLVLEAMKMEHPITAPADGVVAELRVSEGEQVENGVLLLSMEGSTETGSS